MHITELGIIEALRREQHLWRGKWGWGDSYGKGGTPLVKECNELQFV